MLVQSAQAESCCCSLGLRVNIPLPAHLSFLIAEASGISPSRPGECRVGIVLQGMDIPPHVRRGPPDPAYGLESPPRTRRGPPEPEAAQVTQPRNPAAGSESDSVTDSDYTDSDEGSSSAGEYGGPLVPAALPRTTAQRVPALGLSGVSRSAESQESATPRIWNLGLESLSLNRQQPEEQEPLHSQCSIAQGLAQKLALPLGVLSRQPAATLSEENTPTSSMGISSSTSSVVRRGLSLQLPRSPASKGHGDARGGDEIASDKMGAANVISVDLVSSGFHLELPEDSATPSSNVSDVSSRLEYIRERCMRSLGVSPSDLRFYEIRQLADDEPLPPGCRTVGVAVKPSSEPAIPQSLESSGLGLLIPLCMVGERLVQQ